MEFIKGKRFLFVDNDVAISYHASRLDNPLLQAAIGRPLRFLAVGLITSTQDSNVDWLA